MHCNATCMHACNSVLKFNDRCLLGLILLVKMADEWDFLHHLSKEEFLALMNGEKCSS